jgi:PAS domain S-box-containing protein
MDDRPDGVPGICGPTARHVYFKVFAYGCVHFARFTLLCCRPLTDGSGAARRGGSAGWLPEGEVMTGPQIDYTAVYRQLPIPVLLLTPEFAVADVNLVFEQTTGRTREELLGRNIFDAFPEDPKDPDSTVVRNSLASLRRVLATGEPDAQEFQRGDIEVAGSPGRFARHYWSGVNAPVTGPDGSVVLIASVAEEVTDRLRRFMSAIAADES